MRRIVVDGPEEFVGHAASLIASRVASQPALVLTLPTGGTPAPVYERLVSEHRAGRFSLEAATVFMLDEYLDLPHYPEGSFREYLEQRLGDLIFNGATTVHALAPLGDALQCANYDAQLDAAGGLDLAVVGVGRNGHVGFNEPGTSPEARTHEVTLSASTLGANFTEVDEATRPSRAVTMGLRDLRRARSVLMLVSGESKGDVARTLVAERFDPEVPATWLLGHPRLTMIVAGDLL